MKTRNHFLSLILAVSVLFACQKSETSDDNSNVNSSDNRIISYEIQNYGNAGEIDQEKQTVKLLFGANANLSMITPMIIISSGAKSEPPSGQTVDLTNPKEYIITAADGITRTYVVTATRFTKKALMIVDLQNGYFPFYNDIIVVANTQSLITKARAANKKIIFIQTDSPDSPINTWEFQIFESLQPSPNDIYILKRLQNSFDESTDLVSVLNMEQIGSLVVCGIATQYCLNATIIHGIRKGYEIIVAADAHSSYDPYAQIRIDSFNTQWSNLGATVLNTDQIDF